MNKTVLKATGTCDGQPIQFKCRKTSKGYEWFTCDKLKRWVNTDIGPQKDTWYAKCALIAIYPVERYNLEAPWIE